MRKINFSGIVLLLMLFSSCSNNQSVEEQTTETINDQTHNSKNSLDWKGVYKGILPCSDCEGIETQITLNEDFSYHFEEKHLDKPENERKTKTGIFSWTSDGNAVQLQGLIPGADFFAVGENSITQLDAKGNKIVGEEASRYILTKTDLVSSVTDHKTTLETYEWQLTEVISIPVEKNDKTPTLYFDFKEMRYNGFAGCNHYHGTFGYGSGDSLRFGETAFTKKACADPGVEMEYLVVLKKVDRFEINGTDLMLRRGDESPMARFTGVAKK